MEEFIEEFNRRVLLIDGVGQSMFEAHLQKQLMVSNVMRDDMNDYRMRRDGAERHRVVGNPWKVDDATSVE